MTKPEMTYKDRALLLRLIEAYGEWRVLKTFSDIAYEAHRMSKTYPHAPISEAAHALYDWEAK